MEGQLNEEFHVLRGVSVTKTRVPAKERHAQKRQLRAFEVSSPIVQGRGEGTLSKETSGQGGKST